MELTLEILDKQLAEFTEQHKNLVAQANAVSGAIQAVELLRKKLCEPAPIPMPFPGTLPFTPDQSVPPMPIPLGPNTIPSEPMTEPETIES